MLATNTSSLSVVAMAEGLARPERLLGLHFFNPAPVKSFDHRGLIRKSLLIDRSRNRTAAYGQRTRRDIPMMHEGGEARTFRFPAE